MQTSAIQVHFSIPYRVKFGQTMSIVGSATELGAWAEDHRVSHQLVFACLPDAHATFMTHTKELRVIYGFNGADYHGLVRGGRVEDSS